MINQFSFISELISVEEIRAKQLEIKKNNEILKENIYNRFAEAYIQRMKIAINESILVLSSFSELDYTRLNILSNEKLIIESGNGNSYYEIYFYEVHDGINDIYDKYSNECTSIPNPIFENLFKNLQNLLLERGYYLIDESKCGELELNLYLDKPHTIGKN